ncbi:hypothetical protein EHZ47_01490 [Aeromonas jandaei]|nr:hypothetical protein FT670_00520 [Aeromonas jandaei]QNF17820.1 hypothetical protein FT669_13295 [Aeromonas jandaei]RQM78797.1 hypothetical protein EHZ47_01490 [Aeromonas jandaei]
MTGVIDIEKTRTPVGNVVDLQGVLAGPVSHGLCLANERREVAFVTLNHIQTILCKAVLRFAHRGKPEAAWWILGSNES